MQLPQYNPALATAALTDDEQDELDALLDGLDTDAALNLEALDGYCCALLLSPQLPAPEVWLPPVWGADAPPAEGDSAPFASGKQLKRCVQTVLRHLADVHRRLQADADGFEPLFGVAQLDDEEGTFVADAEAWCIGFLQAAALQPAFWDPLFDDTACGLALAPITLFAADPAELGEDERGLLGDIEQRDSLSHQVQGSIGVLWRTLKTGPSAAS